MKTIITMISLVMTFATTNALTDGVPAPDEVTVNVLRTTNSLPSAATGTPGKKGPVVNRQGSSTVASATPGSTTPPGGGNPGNGNPGGGNPPSGGSPPPSVEQRPGHGYGDKNHEHTGPPGQTGFNPMSPNFPSDKAGGGGAPNGSGPKGGRPETARGPKK